MFGVGSVDEFLVPGGGGASERRGGRLRRRIRLLLSGERGQVHGQVLARLLRPNLGEVGIQRPSGVTVDEHVAVVGSRRRGREHVATAHDGEAAVGAEHLHVRLDGVPAGFVERLEERHAEGPGRARLDGVGERLGVKLEKLQPLLGALRVFSHRAP